MADVLTNEQRRYCMSRIRGKDTKPEIIVRKMVHSMGYRFRLHQRKLPGTPDMVLPRHHKVIFVHGCFWHAHANCRLARQPGSNKDYWSAKLSENVDRDLRKAEELRRSGWRVVIIWQCETSDPVMLEDRLCREFSSQAAADRSG